MKKLFSYLLLLCLPSFVCSEEIIYLRTIKLPNIVPYSNTSTFSYCEGPIAVEPISGDIFLRGHANYNNAVRLKLLEMDGATATIVGNWFDLSGGFADSEKIRTSTPTSPKTYHARGAVCNDEGELHVCLSQWYNVTNLNGYPFLTHDLVTGITHGNWNGGQHSLKLGRMITPLSEELRGHFKVRYAGCEIIAQGIANSHLGPAMYVFDLPSKATPALTTFPSSFVLGWPALPVEARFRDWYPPDEIHGMVSLPESMIWVGWEGYTDIGPTKPHPTNGTPKKWYGLGTQTFVLESDGSSVVVVDEASSSQGYHSDGRRQRCFRIPNAKIKAGLFQGTAGFIQETDVEDITFANTGWRLTGATYDRSRKLLYLLESRADTNSRAVIRIYKVN